MTVEELDLLISYIFSLLLWAWDSAIVEELELLISYIFSLLVWAWDSVVVKALRCAISRKVPGSIPGHVTGDFFPKHPTSPCARGRLSL